MVHNKRNFVRSGVLTAVIMKNTIVCDVTPCRLVNVCRQFGGACFLHPQSRRVLYILHYKALQLGKIYLLYMQVLGEGLYWG